MSFGNPYREMRQMMHQMNRMMNQFQRPGFGGFGDVFDDTDLMLDVPLLLGPSPFESGVGGWGQGGRQGQLGGGVGGVGKGIEESKSMEVDAGVGGAGAGQGGQQLTTTGGGVGGQQLVQHPAQLGTLAARINIEDAGDKLIVTGDMPGFDKANLKINVSDDGLLTIKGEQTKEWTEQSKNKKYIRAERSFANVCRTIRLPKNVDTSKISAEYLNGVLHVNVPKIQKEETKPQSNIQIQ